MTRIITFVFSVVVQQIPWISSALDDPLVVVLRREVVDCQLERTASQHEHRLGHTFSGHQGVPRGRCCVDEMAIALKHRPRHDSSGSQALHHGPWCVAETMSPGLRRLR